MAECSVTVRRSDELSTDELYAVLKLRTDVFFLEQHIDEEELDWRDLEPTTVHYFVREGRDVVACLRVLLDDEPEHRDARRIVGRVVVHADHRGKGLAHALLEAAIADFGGDSMLLHAQEYIAPLYARHGFVAFGDVYQEAGIPHLSMYRASDPVR
ncbi:GNAT family N-acetyltransferase [Antiquaquibacter oligotrophicus]|uniref:GNAT family N-acetyltransferase n=1 Tax=Antiquaquibacter oligotrophicus TaxID=2880260 RepID=UPI002AC8EA16|nr:GNAT family N-acetyltransferase [Antiquaquibacter oligotrophicus]UDF14112.1 GNAT family N-acetyltransferase [Antiquaquibacter oligotrophicus]